MSISTAQPRKNQTTQVHNENRPFRIHTKRVCHAASLTRFVRRCDSHSLCWARNNLAACSAFFFLFVKLSSSQYSFATACEGSKRRQQHAIIVCRGGTKLDKGELNTSNNNQTISKLRTRHWLVGRKQQFKTEHTNEPERF